jgi:multiple sugar transport system permease protein
LTKAGIKIAKKSLNYFWMIIVVVPVFVVFAWMFLASIKTQMQNTAIPPLIIFQPTFENYVRALAENKVIRSIWNSFSVATASTLLALLFGLPAAYSLARWKNNTVSIGILTARMMPGISYLVPWFIFFTRLRMIDTPPALILAHLTITLPLVVWTMMGFYEGLPDSLRDAALIDGCTEYGIFLRIYLPLSVAGVIVSGILAYIFSWNNFMYSLILGGNRVRTLPVAIYKYIQYAFIDWGALNATAVIVVLPVIVLTLLVQKHIAKGLTLGAIKG